jgi:aryl-alcohol dehydrogenase-like predicted oxidoreductase
MMRYVRMGRTDLEVSVIALGCGNFGGIGSAPELFGRGEDEAAAFALMDAARAHGVTLFDTANSYGGGRSEEWIGRWLARRGARDEMVLATKVRSPVGPGQRDEGLSARHIREQIEASLRRLGTDHVDLYLAHAPDTDVPIEETLAAFDELVRAGKVRHAGLSNYAGPELVEAVDAAGRIAAAAPVNLQSSYSLLDRAAADEVFDACAGSGIGFTAYSRLAVRQVPGRSGVSGRVTDDVAPGPLPPVAESGDVRRYRRAGPDGDRPWRVAGDSLAGLGAHRSGRQRHRRRTTPPGAARAGLGGP